MKLTYNQLINIGNALSHIANIEGIRDFSFKMQVIRNLNKIKTELNLFQEEFSKERNAILSKYASKNENGNIIVGEEGIVVFPNKKNETEAINEINKLGEIIIDIDLEKLSKDVIAGLPDNVQEKITCNLIEMLLPIMDE